MRLVPVLAAVLACATAVAAAPAGIVSHRERGNRIDMTLNDGAAVLEWITTSTFRFCRTWNAAAPCGFPRPHGPVTHTTRETSDYLESSTEYIGVRVRRSDLRVEVRRIETDAVMLEESATLERAASSVVQRVKATPGQVLWGLRAPLTAALDLTGRRIASHHPFLMSGLGFGLYYTQPGAYDFDLGAADAGTLRIAAPGGGQIDYLFYYGPRQKDIFEQHKEVQPVADGDPQFESDSEWMPRYTRPLPPTASLCDTVHALVSATLGGARVPAVDLEPLRALPPALRRRALEFAEAVPFVFHISNADAAGLELLRVREHWRPHLVTYLQEAWDRGYPMIHTLPFQFPEDARANSRADEFLLGDEVLIAPACDTAPRRDVYLPRGIWTDLRTNQVYTGRQVISTDASPLPRFARNGSILILRHRTEPALLELHYFPKLGAEYFLAEPDLGDVSQFHASPAGPNILRLEIESKKDRPQEWIVHHWTTVTSVRHNGVDLRQVNSHAALAAGTWFVDAAAENLHVRLDARAGADEIVNVTY